VKVKPVRKLKYSVPLVAIKSDKSFANWSWCGFRASRLCPCPKRLEEDRGDERRGVTARGNLKPRSRQWLNRLGQSEPLASPH